MLNSVARLSPDERRRQLVGIGLQMLVDRPIQDLPLDDVAREAGISRGLLFHYFPTKTDFYEAVLGAARRRVVRNVSPDADASPSEAIEQLVTRFFAQVERRRAFYLALVFGSGAVALGGEGVETFRMAVARRAQEVAGLDESLLDVVHGWTAYVEDRALRWTGLPASSRAPREDEIAHCCRALTALVGAA